MTDVKTIEEFGEGALDVGMCEHLIHEFKAVRMAVSNLMGFEDSHAWHSFITGWIYAHKQIETPLNIEQSSLLAEYMIDELHLV